VITDWNIAAERMCGVTHAAAVGRPLVDVIAPPRCLDAYRDGVRRFLADDQRRLTDQRFELTAWHSSGREFPVELVVWSTPDGDRATFAALVRDISERRRTDEERERLLAEHRLLLESATQGIYRLDPDGRCVFANPAAAGLLRWPQEQLVGSRIHALIHRGHPAGTECAVQTVQRTGRPVRVDEDLLWRGDGTSFPAEYTCAPLLTEGRIDGVVVAFTDLSERRQTERSLRAAYEHEKVARAKLTELDDAKSNFLATVSHELRTPLTGLVGYLELLTDGDVGQLTDHQRRVLGTVSRNADRLRALIDDLLTVSNVEARPLVLSPVEIGLTQLIEQAVSPVEEASRRRGHQLRVEVDPSIVSVQVDPVQFRRVLTSLVDNAIKCTPPGGRIDVTARSTAGGVEIAVRDNGIGIDHDEVPRLFTRFFRTNAATQLAIQGAGLSLAIARQIVDGHGGSIKVDTQPGEGATFTVSLPAAA
jgi:PAS domain S-box-containing protein